MKTTISQKQQEISDLTLKLSQAKIDLQALQLEQIETAKAKVLKKYLKILSKKPWYFLEPDLLDAIFYMAKVQSSPVPTIKIKILLNSEVIITYYNNRLDIECIL